MTGEPNGQWATRDDVRQLGLDIIGQVDRRFGEARERGDEKHGENREVQAAILAEAERTNRRITRLEVETGTLKDEFKAVRERWHAFRESITTKLPGPQGIQGIHGVPGESGENRHVTMRDVYMFCGGFGIFYALAKMLKWLP